ncbi:hypothetical protein B484DRAFT_393362 [Ochromonadaceae sp. CCMP2298]|nr:hypothetical protein B484DRAFT_393362 [Ochromonadaceae sp. CCMP2298]
MLLTRLVLLLAALLSCAAQLQGLKVRGAVAERAGDAEGGGAVDLREQEEVLRMMTTTALVDMLEQMGVDMGEDVLTKPELIEFAKSVLSGGGSLMQDGGGRQSAAADTADAADAANATDAADAAAGAGALGAGQGVVESSSAEATGQTQTMTDAEAGAGAVTGTEGTPEANPFAPRVLPDDASDWDLVREQVRSDLAPLLMLLDFITPTPVKRAVIGQLESLGTGLAVAVRGAALPMLGVAAKVVRGGAFVLGEVADTLEYVQKGVSGPSQQGTQGTQGKEGDKGDKGDKENKANKGDSAPQKPSKQHRTSSVAGSGSSGSSSASSGSNSSSGRGSNGTGSNRESESRTSLPGVGDVSSTVSPSSSSADAEVALVEDWVDGSGATVPLVVTDISGVGIDQAGAVGAGAGAVGAGTAGAAVLPAGTMRGPIAESYEEDELIEV